jgi:hypothetical protein
MSIRHPRWTVLILAGLGLSGSIGADTVLHGTIDEYPLTANVVASLLGAPLLLFVALVALDRFTAAERRRGWVARNQEELLDTTPGAIASLKTVISSSWPSTASHDDVYGEVVHMIEEFEAVPAQAGPGRTPIRTDLSERVAEMRSLLPYADRVEMTSAIRALQAAVEPLAVQQDAPRLSEVALDTRLLCFQASSALESNEYRLDRFNRLLDRVSKTPTDWDSAGKAFVAEFSNGQEKFSPQYVAHNGFGYLELYSLVCNLDRMCDQLLIEIKRTIL